MSQRNVARWGHKSVAHIRAGAAEHTFGGNP